MKYAFVVCLIGLVVGSAEAQVTTHGMTVTPGPVFWSGSRLAAAQARYSASPGNFGLVSPMGGTTHRVLQMAFQYRMTGTCAAANGFSNATQIDTCGDAIAWLLNTTDCGGGCRNEYLFPGGASATTANYQALDDHARWLGEIAILGYSWLRDQLSAADRQALLGRLVRATAATATKDWGAPVDPANNYMWGYTRNLIETALVLAAQESNATYAPVTVNCSWSPGAGANAMNLCNDSLNTVVDELLDEGIDVRWTGHLLPHLNGPAKGGVLNEGQNYGHYLLNYMTVPMMLMEDYGRVAREETPYWKEAVWALIYATSNRAIYPVQAGVLISGAPSPAWHQAPTYGNTQAVHGSPYVGEFEESAFMTWMAIAYDGTFLGDRARYWLTTVSPKLVGWMKVIDADRGSPGVNYSALPLAYCGDGFKFCYLRDSWNAGASDKPTMFFIEGEAVNNPGGNHPDSSTGSWQAWRGQRWVSKEAASAYQRAITNLSGTGATNGGQRLAHNGFTINDSDDNGFSLVPDTTDPQVTRLQIAPDSSFVFIATNLTQHLRDNIASGAMLTSGWRDFLWIRHINTLCTFDRIVTTSNVTKNTFVHFPVAPTQAGNTFTGVNGGEALRAVVLADNVANTSVTYTVRDESDFTVGSAADVDPQVRLEVRTTGATTSYIPICVQAYSVGDAVIDAALVEDGDSIDITITRAGAATVVANFAKTTSSTGGFVSIGSTTTSFSNSVQVVTADQNRVTWTPGAPSTAPTAPTNLQLRTHLFPSQRLEEFTAFAPLR